MTSWRVDQADAAAETYVRELACLVVQNEGKSVREALLYAIYVLHRLGRQPKLDHAAELRAAIQRKEALAA